MDLEISNETKKINDSFSKELENHLTNSKFSIDRFEGNFAVCENLETGEMVNIEKSLLPENVKEGSILKYENNTYILEITETISKQENIKNIVNNLFKK